MVYIILTWYISIYRILEKNFTMVPDMTLGKHCQVAKLSHEFTSPFRKTQNFKLNAPDVLNEHFCFFKAALSACRLHLVLVCTGWQKQAKYILDWHRINPP